MCDPGERRVMSRGGLHPDMTHMYARKAELSPGCMEGLALQQCWQVSPDARGA
jgi:hypothetical protein